MKKLLIGLLLIITTQSFGQVVWPKVPPTFQQFGSSTTWSQFNGTVYPVVGFITPTYDDTTVANGNGYAKFMPFNIISTSDGGFWRRNFAATKWEEIGVGGTPTWQQTLTTGSTLTTNNTVAGGGFDWTHNNIGTYTLSKSSVDRFTLSSSETSLFSPDGNSTISVDNSFIFLTGSGASTIAIGSSGQTNVYSNGDVQLASGGNVDLGSGIKLNSVSGSGFAALTLQPRLGDLRIDTLTNLSTQNTLLGWKQGSGQGQVGYVTLGTGLSLSSGVLSNSGVTSTPTWQQTLTAGSTITSDVNITSGTQDINWVGTTGVWDQSMEAFGWTASKSGRNSVLALTNDSISINPGFGNIHIDTLLNRSNQNALMGWDSAGTDRGQVGYVTLGSGLSLSSGVLNTSGTVPTPISSLTAATGTNSISNGDYTQTWNWPTLTNGTGLLLTSLASTTGTTGGSVLTVLRSGALANASQTTYGAIIQNQHTGTTETNVGLKVEATGATNNYALIVPSGSGNVGIGTSSPGAALEVYPSVDGNVFIVGNAAFDPVFNIETSTQQITMDGAGLGYKVGIGTNSPSVALDVVGDVDMGKDGTYTSGLINTSVSSGTVWLGDWNGLANGTKIEVADGSSRINFTGSSGFVFYAGNVRMTAYGAGTATFDASGNISSVSDIRLKNVQGGYNVGLSALMKIKPIVYKWNAKSKMETEHNYIGFSAQNILSALGQDATGINKDGYLSIQDRAIMATMVVAIQEQQKQIEELKNEIKKLKRK